MKIDIIKNIFLILVLVTIPFWIIWKNIFPTIKIESNLKDYSYYERNIILRKEINGNDFLIFPCKEDYNFDKLKLIIKSKNKINNQLPLPLEKGYESMLYPIEKENLSKEDLRNILFHNNSSPIPNGSLISNNDTVFLVVNGKYHPIASEYDFTKLGYFWENIIPVDNSELTMLEEGDKIYNHDVHPNSTILKNTNNEFFIINNKKLLPLNEEILVEVWPNYNWVNIESQLLSLGGDCQLKNNGKKSICQYTDKPVPYGNTYIFNLKQLENPEIENIKIQLKTDISKNRKESLIFFLGKIKQQIKTRLDL